ncbi:outer membrane protein assembly factor [Arenibacter sp. TNZ]|jgi:outer membrane protein assembly factor BamA|uniref:POTRA domain-containing protein n=1 Tax=Arenibacter TaxID=178469 RepID=UPI000CD4831F|nr:MULTISPECIES: POTRA domain-containing protein [Arenibacter]MCM4172053.1 outer membrane protein assembly factor [Arenibacter sp. TNZ]
MKIGLRVLLFFLFITGYTQQSTVTTVNFEGAKRTKISFLENFVKVRTGNLLDSLVLKEDVQRLKQLPSIANAVFRVDANTENHYSVVYTVEEHFTLIPFANLYTSTNDEFAYRIGVQEYNLLGKNMILGGFYQRDIFNSYGINFRAPYIIGGNLGFAMSYNNIATLEPVFINDLTADYKYKNKAFEVLGLYNINNKNKIDFGINWFTEDYNYITGATSPNVPQDLKVDKYLYKLIYSYENIEYDYHYRSGFSSVLNFQYVKSPDENLPEFLIGFNDFIYYKRLGYRGNWANRLRLGIASNIDTPFAPFSVDNNVNIRGVGNKIDRGTGTIVFNTEYRYSFMDRDWFALQGNFFVDSGTWRNPGGDFSDFTDRESIRVYPGIGLRFIHKRVFNAIFRIDYGHGITKNASKGIVFGIGQYF